MTEKQTRKFVALWNKANGMAVGENTPQGNMRYVGVGLITWNEYDAPTIELEQFRTLLEEVK